MRGIAALFVFNRHTSIFWDFTLHRTYLAVDLFFILSGFVISFAYDEKIKSGAISVKFFVLLRLIRLYPIYFISVILCAVILIYKLLTESSPAASDFQQIIVIIGFALFFLPVKVPGDTVLFHINGPYWSLFYELISNLVYVVIRPVLKTAVLIGIIFVCGVIVALSAYQHGNLDVGFNWGILSNITGFSRAMLGISLGLLLHRKFAYFSEKIITLSPWLAIGVMSATLMLPSMGRLNTLIDLIAVFCIFPLCVLWGAQGVSARGEKILVALGSASYPIYVLHVPVGQLTLLIFHDAPRQYAPLSGVVLMIALIIVSILLEKTYDIPLRRWLSAQAFFKKIKGVHAPSKPAASPRPKMD